VSLRGALRDPDPIALLMAVSGMLDITDVRRSPAFGQQIDASARRDLIDSFIGTDYAETTAVLHVMRALMDDEGERERITAELGRRRHPMPEWIRELPRAAVAPVVTMLTDVLGDGDDYFISVEMPSGDHVTALIYVDHNLGGVVKAAMAWSTPIEEFLERAGESLTAPGQSLVDVDPALARATVERAISQGAMLWPPLETEMWPMGRPLIEWMVRMLPEGGFAPEFPEWTPAQLEEIADAFWASPFAEGVDPHDGPALLESILWLASGYTDGDPWRWSNVNVEMLLVDWFPRKVIADAEFLSGMPDVLRAYIRYCHDLRRIPAERTRETLESVDMWEDDFQRLIRSDRLQGAEALASYMLEGDDDEYDDGISDSEWFLRSLERAVGDRDTLMALDTDPLPDEDFPWDGIPEDIREAVGTVLSECDRVADEMFDTDGRHEARSAMRRLLSRVAAGDPAIFRRRASLAKGAAAIAWLILRANDYPHLYVKDMTAAFGVSGSLSQRAEPMLRAIGVDPYHRYGAGQLGSPDFLTSTTRASIIRKRDWTLAEDDEDFTGVL
jgi:hypothetical protein